MASGQYKEKRLKEALLWLPKQRKERQEQKND
jgi:hypothetical protein